MLDLAKCHFEVYHGGMMNLPVEFGPNRKNHFEVIQFFFLKFLILPAAILDLKKFHVVPAQCLQGGKMNLRLKFG